MLHHSSKFELSKNTKLINILKSLVNWKTREKHVFEVLSCTRDLQIVVKQGFTFLETPKTNKNYLFLGTFLLVFRGSKKRNPNFTTICRSRVQERTSKTCFSRLFALTRVFRLRVRPISEVISYHTYLYSKRPRV